METLVITPFLPWPLVFGGAIRTYYMLRMLAEFSNVTLLTYPSWTAEDSKQHLETICREVVIADPKPGDLQGIRTQRFRSLVSRRSNQFRAHHGPALQQRIDQLAASRDFDVVVVEMTPMAGFRLPASALRVLDMPNIEHELVSRRAKVASPIRRAVLELEAWKVEREELELTRQFDLLLATSDRETEIIRKWGDVPAETLLNTIDAEHLRPRPGQEHVENRLVFVGSTHVDANRDGVQYFLREIFPRIRAEIPDVVIDIVGGDPPPEIVALGRDPGVTITGYVADIRDYVTAATALVVPLRSGSGTRLKIIEALSMQVPIVSTSLGAEGLDLVDDKHLLVGDDAASFAAATVRLLRDPALRARLRASGAELVGNRFDWRSQAPRLERLLNDATAARVR